MATDVTAMIQALPGRWLVLEEQDYQYGVGPITAVVQAVHSHGLYEYDTDIWAWLVVHQVTSVGSRIDRTIGVRVVALRGATKAGEIERRRWP